MRTSEEVTNALSFDIEDWFHIIEVPAVAEAGTWEKLPSLVEPITEWIIEVLDAAGVRATFFVLGWVASRHPRIVRLISGAGHELGSHSYWHRRVDKLSVDEFREDLRQSVSLLEDLAGKKILGFRAPSFSISPGSEWAFDVMHETGLLYDASLFPARRGHGGYPCPAKPHNFTGTPSGRSILELPMSVLHVGPLRLPFSGGGYLRLLPQAAIRVGFAHFHRRGLPVVVYLHPRDFAPNCPRVPMSLSRRFKCYVGLRTTRAKLHMLLDSYRFDTCASVLGLEQEEAAGARSRKAAVAAGPG
jgi:polysaccharide deacetylase family protein (PEP-CTERM system associated)